MRRWVLGACVGLLWLSALAAYASLPETDEATGNVSGADRTALEQASRRARDYLWQQQSEDGSWRSGKYAVLRSGQALTPFVLLALLEGGAEPPPDGVEQALAFLRRHSNENGTLGLSNPRILEYPNYATACALRCLVRTDRPEDRELRNRQVRYLVEQQMTESRGIARDHAAYGGWNFGGTPPPGQTGHLDLAHTRHVLQALQEAGVDDPRLWERAGWFLARMQRDRAAAPPPADTFAGVTGPFDGGFFFSPVVPEANKGRLATRENDQPYFRSYATSTCDGLLSLLATGVDVDDRRVRAAAAWLEQHSRFDYPAGIPVDYPEPWGEALTFYHLATRAECWARISGPTGWQASLAAELLPRQLEDGRFVNTASELMKEDDPLVATTLSLWALEATLGSSR